MFSDVECSELSLKSKIKLYFFKKVQSENEIVRNFYNKYGMVVGVVSELNFYIHFVNNRDFVTGHSLEGNAGRRLDNFLLKMSSNIFND